MSDPRTESGAAQPPDEPHDAVPEAVQTASDELLLLGARLHDESALAALYKRHGGRVFTQALHLVNDRDLAEEVMQEVFLRCWHGLEQYEPAHGEPSTWLPGITRSRALERLGGHAGPAAAPTPAPSTGHHEPAAIERPPAGAGERLLRRARTDTKSAASAGLSSADAPFTEPLPTDALTAEQRPAGAVPGEDGASSIAAETSPAAPDDPRPPPTIPVRRVQPRPARRIKLASIGWAAALLFVIAAGLFVAMWSATAPHASLGVEMLSRLPGGQVLTFSGAGASRARARLYIVASGSRGELAVTALPQPPQGRVYQVWFAEPGQPIHAGATFTVSEQGDAVVPVDIPAPVDLLHEIAVTQEPDGGSPGPTGARLLEWAP